MCIKRYHTYQDVTFKDEVDSQILDTVRFITDKGILFEPSGQYLTYSGSIVIPFVYTVPGLNIKELPENNCSMYGNIQQLHGNMINHIKDILLTDMPPTKQSRQKRQLGLPIALAAQGVITLFNTYETFSLQSSISSLKDNSELIKQKITSIQTTTNLVVDRLNTVSVVVGDNSVAIIRLAHKMDCIDYYTSVEYQTIISLLSGIPQEFLSAYDAAITGKIHPELLSGKSAKMIINAHSEMKNTLYAQDTGLVYELGKVVIVDAIFGDQPHIKGVMYLPKLLTSSPLPLYNVYTVNYIVNNKNHRIILPEKMVCSSNDTCWAVDGAKCIQSPSKLVCLQGHYHTTDTCIRSLYKKGDMTCKIHVSSNLLDTSIYQLGPSILLGGHREELRTVDVFNTNVSPLGVISPIDTPDLITSKVTPYLIINNELYSTRITGVEYQLIIDISISDHPEILPHFHVPSNWTPIEHLNGDWEGWQLVSSGLGNVFVTITTSALTVITILLLKHLLIDKKPKSDKAEIRLLELPRVR